VRFVAAFFMFLLSLIAPSVWAAASVNAFSLELIGRKIER